jgi:hypothetical protein
MHACDAGQLKLPVQAKLAQWGLLHELPPAGGGGRGLVYWCQRSLQGGEGEGPVTASPGQGGWIWGRNSTFAAFGGGGALDFWPQRSLSFKTFTLGTFEQFTQHLQELR